MLHTRSRCGFIANSIRKYATAGSIAPLSRGAKIGLGVGVTVLSLGAYLSHLEDPRTDTLSEKRIVDIRANTDEETLEKLDRYGVCIISHRRIPQETIEQWRQIVQQEFTAQTKNPLPVWATHQFRPVFTNRFVLYRCIITNNLNQIPHEPFDL
jgi:hypothetical protein